MAPKTDKKKDQAPAVPEDAQEKSGEVASSSLELGLGSRSKKSRKCLALTWKIVYSIISVIAIIIAFVVAIYAIGLTVTERYYDSDSSGKPVAFIILLLSAVSSQALLIWGLVALFKQHAKYMVLIGCLLLIVVLIQLLIAGLSCKTTESDKIRITKSLIKTFRQSKDSDPKMTALWAETQSQFHCCGVFSPDDYNVNLPPFMQPNIHISCCPSYDNAKTDLAQENEREQCKARQEFYKLGCKVPVLESFDALSDTLLGSVITLAVLQVILMLLICCTGQKLLKKLKKRSNTNS